ncbi:hypothetical protein E2C01_027997 [Portunus trituberculatus]|uniref:Uncharacterized protein n=1 Tax=Portunus trituberculatus TaxID=210409 RepID=A0A5B7EK66_PORTR|nr:hypothetical protein [Portunus trituberculatus]
MQRRGTAAPPTVGSDRGDGGDTGGEMTNSKQEKAGDQLGSTAGRVAARVQPCRANSPLTTRHAEVFSK